MPKTAPTLVDLFSGAGGMTLGFVKAGFKPILAVDSEPVFMQTYRANFGGHFMVGPIQQFVNELKRVRADVVIGGPPCQGFSNLALNRADDPRRFLWRYFMDVVAWSGCRVFVMENVPNLLTSAEGRAILKTANDMGFWIATSVLHADRFGVPQARKRAFIVGSKLEMIDLPQGRAKRVTVRDAFNGIPAKPTVREFVQNGPVPSSALHIARNPTPMSLKRYALIPPGGNRFDLQRTAPELTPKCWIRKTEGGTDLYGRLEWDKPARCTIRTEFYKPEKGRYLHPQQDRPITHWEAARLQTFPDDFLWCGSKIQIAVQIGNAVPPKLAEAVAWHVMNHIKAHTGNRRARLQE